MITAVVQIGNTDNKLTQQEWSAFAEETRQTVYYLAGTVFFDAACEGAKPWQNLCIVISTQHVDELHKHLAALAEKYRQGCIALTVGVTEMVLPVPQKE